MKTIYSSIFIAAVCANVNAQFTMLDKWHGPVAGTNESYRLYDSTIAVPRNTGSGITWDYAALSISTVVENKIFKDAGAVPNATNFGAPNIVGDQGAGELLYYHSDSTKLELLGMTQNSMDIKFTDAMQVMKWPFTNGTSFTDTYAGSAGDFSYSGNVAVSGAGYGNVTMPGGITYNNCMQIKVVNTLQVTNTVTPAANSTVQTTSLYYVWDTQRYPILKIEDVHTTNTSTTTTVSRFKVNSLVAVGVTDFNFNAGFAIFPNPAKDRFVVSLTNTNADECMVEVCDITGKAVKAVSLGSAASISGNVSISDLEAGIYLVKTTLGNKSSVRKLVVQ